MDKETGFTLLELLVVIAIIGILAAITLAFLNNARSKGKDATILQDMNNVMSQTSIVYDNNGGTYGTSGISPVAYVYSCSTFSTSSLFGTSTINTIIAQIDQTSGSPSKCMEDGNTFSPSVQRWIMVAPLTASSSASYWCIDSSGQSKGTSSLPSPSPFPTFNC